MKPRQSIVFLILAMSANGLSYVYQLTMARLLTPREYAVVLAIVSFIAIILFPSNSYQAAVAVGTGHLTAGGRLGRAWPFAMRAAVLGGGAATLLAVLFAVFAGQIRYVFGFSENWVLAWLAVTFCLSLVLSSFRGAFQGSHRFAALGAVMLLEASARVVLAVLLVLFGFGVSGATAGFAFGFVGSTLLAAWLLFPKERPNGQNSESLWSTLRVQLRSVPATFAIFGVQAIDVVIANFRLTSDGMEPYSAAALAGRVIFYAGFVLSLLILPRFRDMFASGRFRWGLVWKSSAVMAVIALPAVAAGYAVPGVIHFLLVGPKYSPNAEVMQVYLLGTALLTTGLFLTYLLISAGWHWIWLGTVPAAAAQTAAYLLWAHTPMEFARTLLISASVIATFLAVATALLIVRRTRGVRPEAREEIEAEAEAGLRI